jgi:hypothetical protein
MNSNQPISPPMKTIHEDNKWNIFLEEFNKTLLINSKMIL